MTRLHHDPSTFAQQAIAGFVAANGNYVRQVDGGVARAAPLPEGMVAVVIGGGSGHYPSFAGLVGDGMAAGAACGNIFASPSAGQVHRVAREVERGAGILLSYGNYAGDVLNFGQAEQRLRAEGFDVRTVLVTDDIASAPPDELDRRRGIAGDLAVFKIAGAAAARGDSLDAVEELARRANDRTRSIGVAFSGTTLPGSREPLFTVPVDRMAIGLGIHGEPGLSIETIPTPANLAAELVTRLLNELPSSVVTADRARAAVILNGLGGVKYEELFVIFRLIAEQLEIAGVTIVEPECGELVTSLDMPGLSLTILWLDDELEGLWIAPADAPAYSKTTTKRPPGLATGTIVGDPTARSARVESAVQMAAAPIARDLLISVRDAILEHEEELGRIDAVAGDGDHGLGMSRGVTGATTAANRVIDAGGGVVELLSEAAGEWSESGGGTSGALWGIALSAAASSLSQSEGISPVAIADAVTAALDAIQKLGKAEVGDKTMVDAFAPFAECLAAEVTSGTPIEKSWVAAARRAEQAAEATAKLLPHVGRARPHAEKSLGHPDAGAVSFALIVTTIADELVGSSIVEGAENG